MGEIKEESERSSKEIQHDEQQQNNALHLWMEAEL
jgi:hypothetical protein